MAEAPPRTLGSRGFGVWTGQSVGAGFDTTRKLEFRGMGPPGTMDEELGENGQTPWAALSDFDWVFFS
jgi:hypothetical protein